MRFLLTYKEDGEFGRISGAFRDQLPYEQISSYTVNEFNMRIVSTHFFREGPILKIGDYSPSPSLRFANLSFPSLLILENGYSYVNEYLLAHNPVSIDDIGLKIKEWNEKFGSQKTVETFLQEK